MADLRTAAQQALEALKSCSAVPHWPALQPTITALRDVLAQQEQEQVVYTGDVARTMLESGMTFHLGMPHAIVMKQMTRFYDLVCAEASLRAAAAFAIPPRREWQSLSEEEIKTAVEASADFWATSRGWITSVARAIEQALKEKNNG